ncbi:hypothetical protein B566_EDAN015651, partial [Ephemera danica]
MSLSAVMASRNMLFLSLWVIIFINQTIGAEITGFSTQPYTTLVEREEVNIHSVRTIQRGLQPEIADHPLTALPPVKTEDKERLIGGNDVPFERFSFVVVVVALDETGAEVWPCAGALLTSTYVVTSARCIVDALTVRVKAGNTTSPQIRHGNKIIYPNFYRNTLQNDIALVHLLTPFVIGGNIGTIQLPKNAWGYNTPSLSEKTMQNDWGGPVTYKNPSEPMPVLVGVMSDFV